MRLSDCTRCHPQEGPIISNLRGNVQPADFERDSYAAVAETTQPLNGTIVYHYFPAKAEGGEPLWKIIYVEKAIGSRARCMTETEIAMSVSNASAEHRPHYGDGAYCTLHANFVSACEAVQYAHGLDPHLCTYRAVLAIERQEQFRKFSSTGGVMRSIPNQEFLRKDELIKIGDATGEARLLWIEAYSHGVWRRVSLKKGESGADQSREYSDGSRIIR